jgi:hypothetical protein
MKVTSVQFNHPKHGHIKFSSYLTENKLHLHCRVQILNPLWRNALLFILESQSTYKTRCEGNYFFYIKIIGTYNNHYASRCWGGKSLFPLFRIAEEKKSHFYWTLYSRNCTSVSHVSRTSTAIPQSVADLAPLRQDWNLVNRECLAPNGYTLRNYKSISTDQGI